MNAQIKVFIKSKPLPISDLSFNYPEQHLMPIDAVKTTKKIIDDFLKYVKKIKSKEAPVYNICTLSSDVVAFIDDYGKYKKFDVVIYLGDKEKEVDIEGAFKEFIKGFRYSDKITHKD